MIYKIEGQQPFQVLSDNFSISPATEAYILQVSADGENYTDLFAVAAGVTRMITGVAAGSFYRLKNNVGEVSINWRKDCSAGDGFAYELKPSADLPLVADEGTFAVTSDGIYQFKNGKWVEAGGAADPEKIVEIVEEEGFVKQEDADKRYLQLTGGTLTGHLTLGGAEETSFKKVEAIRKNDTNVNGAAFYVNGDGTAAFFHKAYNGASATNDAILKFDANGLQFAKGNSRGQSATEFHNVVTDDNIKTINGESIVGTGDVKIQGGGETFVELTQAEYDALEEYADNTTYIITDAPEADFATKEYVDNLIGEINNRLANI